MIRRGLAFLLSLLLACLQAPAQQIYAGQSIPSRPNCPANTIGVDNAWYLDWVTGNVYGPKNLGQWPCTPTANTIPQIISGDHTFIGTNTASGPWTFNGSVTFGGSAAFSTFGGALFAATAYGGCKWDGTDADVGTCLQAAINAAHAAGGGTVVVPASPYQSCFSQQTAVVQPYSGVNILGAGIGIPRDNIDNSKFLAATRICWTGAPGAMMFDEEPTGSESQYAANVWGVVFDSNNLAGIGFKAAQVNFSFFNVCGAEARSINVEFTTQNTADSPGSQENDIWVCSRSTSNTYSPTGVLFDQGVGSTWNFSYNRVHSVQAWYNKGDGVVFGSSDNNTVETLRTYPQPGATGRSVVFANSVYVPPNGVPTNGQTGDDIIIHNGSFINVLGARTNVNFVAGANSCNGGGASACGPTTLSTTTTSGGGQNSDTVFLASVAGIVAPETLNCGTGSSTGVEPDAQIFGVGSGSVQLVTRSNWMPVTVGAACTISWGPSNAIIPGSYTITALDGTHVSIAAPPAGHNQASVSTVGGTLAAFDFTAPWTGTMTAGDTWTLVIPTAATNIRVQYTDSGNSIPDPNFQWGSNGAYGRTGQFFEKAFITTQNLGVVVGNGATFSNCLVMANNPSDLCGGIYSATIGGVGAGSTGFGSFATGHNTGASGAFSFVRGEGAVANGFASDISGELGTDGGRYNAAVQGGGAPNGIGSAQVARSVLWGTGATGSAIRLTADGSTAGAVNCLNIPNNAGYSLTVTLSAFDKTTVSKNEAWQGWVMLLTRGANAASTALATTSTPTPLSNGTVTGSAISASADTTNGCLSLSFTPPTSNTDTWDVTAKIDSTESQ